LVATLRGEAFGAVVLTYIADFVPRVFAGLDALGLGDLPPAGETGWDHHRCGIQRFPAGGRAADRARPRHGRDRLCNSLREAAALEAGGSDDMYGDISFYATSTRLSESHKIALRSSTS
jgi:hypothetical protein